MCAAPRTEDVYALVCKSPAKVGGQDRAGWLALFAPEHVVEDPVGSRPVVGTAGDTEPLGHFWDAFIAGNGIVFASDNDWIDLSETGGDVFRDVEIHTTMTTGAVVTCRAHLLYQTELVDGVLRIRRMAAHWEPLPVWMQLAKPTALNLRSGAVMGRRMFANIGLGGAARFIGAIHSPAKGAKAAVIAAAAEQGITLTTLIASGTYVSATGTNASGPVGVLAHIDPDSKAITDLRTFTDRI